MREALQTELNKRKTQPAETVTVGAGPKSKARPSKPVEVSVEASPDSEDEPSPHAKQKPWPLASEYVPALHGRQVAALVCAVSPEKVPAGQSSQAPAEARPDLFDHVPTGHLLQRPKSSAPL